MPSESLQQQHYVHWTCWQLVRDAAHAVAAAREYYQSQSRCSLHMSSRMTLPAPRASGAVLPQPCSASELPRSLRPLVKSSEAPPLRPKPPPASPVACKYDPTISLFYRGGVPVGLAMVELMEDVPFLSLLASSFSTLQAKRFCCQLLHRGKLSCPLEGDSHGSARVKKRPRTAARRVSSIITVGQTFGS